MTNTGGQKRYLQFFFSSLAKFRKILVTFLKPELLRKSKQATKTRVFRIYLNRKLISLKNFRDIIEEIVTDNIQTSLWSVLTKRKKSERPSPLHRSKHKYFDKNHSFWTWIWNKFGEVSDITLAKSRKKPTIWRKPKEVDKGDVINVKNLSPEIYFRAHI